MSIGVSELHKIDRGYKTGEYSVMYLDIDLMKYKY